MSSKSNNMGTYTLSDTGGPTSNGIYTILASDGVTIIALKLATGGAATVRGSAVIKAFGASTAIDLVEEEPTILSNPDPIDGLVITVTSGTVNVLTNQ